jgi:hypothetical protein
MNEMEKTSPSYPANSDWGRDDRETEMQVNALRRARLQREAYMFRPDRIRPMFMPASELARVQ